MIMTKCDRCGNESRYDKDEMPTIVYKHYRDENEEFHIDICKECFNEFVAFMKEKSAPQV